MQAGNKIRSGSQTRTVLILVMAGLWIATLTIQPPEPGRALTVADPSPKRRSPGWARLIAKVYEVDPLVSTRCGQRMSIVAFVTDTFAIRRILDHLGLSPQQQEKPPPIREVLRVAEHGEGWGAPPEWE